MVQLYLVIQISTVTLLGLVGLILAKHARAGLNTWTGIGFTFSILCYVTVESELVQLVPGLRIVATLGAISIPVFFWLLARSIFDDHFEFRARLLTWFLVMLAPHLNLFVGGFALWSGFDEFSSVVARLISLGFLLAGLHIALRTKKGDLIDERIKFRNVFLVSTAALIGATLFVEVISIERSTVSFLQALQRLAIFSITLYFLVSNFTIRAGFFFKEVRRAKVPIGDDMVLSARLQAMMEEQKLYKREGLTIKQLADVLNEQEYRVRRLINGHLGFRNFSDFINQFRVNEACEILSDPGQVQKTVLEIAYSLGYQSMGPFNKAFRELKGMTPTAYRRSQLK